MDEWLAKWYMVGKCSGKELGECAMKNWRVTE
jgi:hypothetical protein